MQTPMVAKRGQAQVFTQSMLHSSWRNTDCRPRKVRSRCFQERARRTRPMNADLPAGAGFYHLMGGSRGTHGLHIRPDGRFASLVPEAAAKHLCLAPGSRAHCTHCCRILVRKMLSPLLWLWSFSSVFLPESVSALPMLMQSFPFQLRPDVGGNVHGQPRDAAAVAL
eukprot:SAG11_NODE_5799_length_1461_cov_1.284875_2_plen_167_part_00